MSTSTVLELLSVESRWTKGAYAKNNNSAPVPIYDTSAVCYCLLGAINRIYGDSQLYLWALSGEEEKAINQLSNAIGNFPNNPDSSKSSHITKFNDNDGTTHEDVIRVLEKAEI